MRLFRLGLVLAAALATVWLASMAMTVSATGCEMLWEGVENA